MQAVSWKLFALVSCALAGSVHATIVAEPFGTCLGIANIQCPTGYECRNVQTGVSDPAGTCLPVSQNGQACGGFLGIACATGYTCELPQDNVADAQGVCKPVRTVPADAAANTVPPANTIAAVGAGETCGGFIGVPCQSGLDCKITDTTVSDAQGVCVSSTQDDTVSGAALGETCGGFVGVSCQTGLECNITETDVSDAQGTCVVAAPKDGEPGGRCGGFVGIPCSQGYECIVSSTQVADDFGVCTVIPTGTLGQACTGSRGSCDSGLQCAFSNPQKTASGVCTATCPKCALGQKCLANGVCTNTCSTVKPCANGVTCRLGLCRLYV